MKEKIEDYRNQLLSVIHSMEKDIAKYVKQPEKDFKRRRKMTFLEHIKFTLELNGGSLNKELAKHFDFSRHLPTVSAFVQQRKKLNKNVFEELFHKYNQVAIKQKLCQGFRLLACDGSDVRICHNPNDEETYIKSSDEATGYNYLHLNTLYDLCNKTFVDAIVENRRNYNEAKACISMLKRRNFDKNTIIIADRGYENYNLFENISKLGLYYLVRVKDIESKGILSGLKDTINPPSDTFDENIDLKLSRKQTKEIKKDKNIKFMPDNQQFDFLPKKSNEIYSINLRIIRFKIKENTYESIITNIPAEIFNGEEIKQLYNIRWGIETGFRELKYAIGLNTFHSRCKEFNVQEIYARLTMYNFCKVIALASIIQSIKETKYNYQINFSMSITICKNYLVDDNQSFLDVAELIRKYILPKRPGRHDIRNIRTQAFKGFNYRIA